MKENYNIQQLHFLVVDDNKHMSMLIKNLLHALGSRMVAEANDAADAFAELTHFPADIIITDYHMQPLDGLDFVRLVRTGSDSPNPFVPIIMLSARSEEVDRVRGLETGADDYVVKPYSVIELMARVRAQLRRARPAAAGLRLEYEDIVLDSETHRVTRGSKPLKLGPTEFRLLTTFMEKPGRVWSREQLLDRVWGRDIYVDTRTVDVHIGRLRKALCQHGGNDPLRTVRGAGYALG